MFKLVIDLNQLQAAFYLQIRQRNRHMAVLKRDVGASGDVTKTTFSLNKLSSLRIRKTDKKKQTKDVVTSWARSVHNFAWS